MRSTVSIGMLDSTALVSSFSFRRTPSTPSSWRASSMASETSTAHAAESAPPEIDTT